MIGYINRFTIPCFKRNGFFFPTQTYPPQGQKHTWNKKTSRHAQIKDSHEMRGNTKREG